MPYFPQRPIQSAFQYPPLVFLSRRVHGSVIINRPARNWIKKSKSVWGEDRCATNSAVRTQCAIQVAAGPSCGGLLFWPPPSPYGPPRVIRPMAIWAGRWKTGWSQISTRRLAAIIGSTAIRPAKARSSSPVAKPNMLHNCLAAAPVRRAVSSSSMKSPPSRANIRLSRWGDYDPSGYLYTLNENVPAVVAQSQATEAANYGLSLGLGDDVIQPMTMRANVGDCLRVRAHQSARRADIVPCPRGRSGNLGQQCAGPFDQSRCHGNARRHGHL